METCDVCTVVILQTMAPFDVCQSLNFPRRFLEDSLLDLGCCELWWKHADCIGLEYGEVANRNKLIERELFS